jgi:hypothetical protein
MERLIGEVIDTFSSGKSETVLATFVDLAAQIDEENLSRVEDLIAERRRQIQGAGP